MSWQFGGSPSAHSNSSTVPVCRIGGVHILRKYWTATAFPISLPSGQVALITTGHSLEDVASWKLLEVGNVAAVDSLDFQDVMIPAGSLEPIHVDWITTGFDLAVRLFDPQDVGEWRTLWRSSDRWAAPAKKPFEGARSLEVVALPRPIIRSGPGAEFRGTVWTEVSWFHQDQTSPATEYLIDTEPIEGASGSPVFIKDDEGLAFAGIVTKGVGGRIAILNSCDILEVLMSFNS